MISNASTEVNVALAIVGVAWLTTLVIQVRRRGRRLQVAADRAYPDPLD